MKNQNDLEDFLTLKNSIPSHDTFTHVFSRVEPEQFMKCFLSAVESMILDVKNEFIAIDGKTLRRSHDNSSSKDSIHMVSAQTTENKLVLGQVKIAEKSNEITAIPELLKTLALQGCIIIIDAMGCQKEIAKTIEGKGALAVNANQVTLHEAIKATLDWRAAKGYLNPAIDYFEAEEKNRNCKEIRRCWVTQSLN